MDKLISANSLYKKLSTNYKGERIREYDADNFPVTLTLREIKKIIIDEPAAFDKEKVKVELQTKADRINDELIDADTTEHLIYLKGKEDGFRETIEIFEKGSVE